MTCNADSILLCIGSNLFWYSLVQDNCQHINFCCRFYNSILCVTVCVWEHHDCMYIFLLYRVDGSGRSYKISILEEIDNGTNGVKPSLDYVTFLPDPILVRGAVLVSNGQCSLSSPLQVNISSESGIRKLKLT